MIAVSKIFNLLFKNLTSRQREVVVGRFGIDKSGKPQTLAALGKTHGVTRERIRQIENSALAVLRKEVGVLPACVEILEKSKKHLKDSGGVAKKEDLVDHLRSFVDGIIENHLAFLLEASRAFHFYPEDRHFYRIYKLLAHDRKV